MKRLTKKEQDQFIRFLDSWLRTWSKNRENGTYGNLWKIFLLMKDNGIDNRVEFKQLGGYGLHLLNIILYSFQEYSDEDIREEGEPQLVEAVIALHLLIGYLKDELKILKIKNLNKYRQ